MQQIQAETPSLKIKQFKFLTVSKTKCILKIISSQSPNFFKSVESLSKIKIQRRAIICFVQNTYLQKIITVYDWDQSVLEPPNNNTTVLLIQNLYFSIKIVFKNTNSYFRWFLFSENNTNLYYRVTDNTKVYFLKFEFSSEIQMCIFRSKKQQTILSVDFYFRLKI